MTRIKFYSRVAEPQDFACRLAATVVRKGERLLVLCPDEAAADAFGIRLWGLDEVRFVPNCRIDAPEAGDTPVWIASTLPGPGVALPPFLLNLQPNFPDHPERFSSILEIAGRDDDSLAFARDRFRTYRLEGYEIDHYDMSDK